jgi:tetratricopeptide (TPR) repeat protein
LRTSAEIQDGLIKEKYKDETVYYMTVGNEPDYFESLDYVAKTIMTKEPKGLKFEYTQMLDDDHGSVPHLSIYNGLLYIYSGWKLKPEVFNEGIAAIDMHYKNISKKFGYEIHTPEMTINRLGYTYLTNDEIDKAIIVFQVNVKRFPSSANVYDSLGEAYENNGQFDKAEANYAKAVELAEKKKHPNLKIYKKNLQRMQEKS